jgi:hypothetical protein
MLACYGTEALGSHPAIGKEESEILMVLYFFQSDIRADIYVVFIGPSHFLSARPIKPNSFQELWTYKD